MYFEPAGDRRATPRRASFRVVLVINTAAVALLGLLPNALLELCGRLLQ
jgi:NADH:ubiquinone oxidoreductase subunit 2 (subunit N)